MALLTILRYPDPRLHTVAKPVPAVDARIRTLVADMLETMYDAEGIGLAATQVDVHERLVVIDVSRRARPAAGADQPRITWASDEKQVNDEGCLSVPGIYDGVERSSAIKVQALDADGKSRKIDGRRPAGGLHPARDGPPDGQGVRRIPVTAQAQPHQDQDAQAEKGAAARRALSARTLRCRPAAAAPAEAAGFSPVRRIVACASFLPAPRVRPVALAHCMPPASTSRWC